MASGLHLLHDNPTMSAIDGNSDTRVADGRMAIRSLRCTPDILGCAVDIARITFIHGIAIAPRGSHKDVTMGICGRCGIPRRNVVPQ